MLARLEGALEQFGVLCDSFFNVLNRLGGIKHESFVILPCLFRFGLARCMVSGRAFSFRCLSKQGRCMTQACL